MSRRSPRCLHPLHPRAGGAAVITAMLTVALVALLSAHAFWQQWRSIEVQTAGLDQLQARWLLIGTLDWGRARLHQDGRLASGVDHSGEAWAQPVTAIPLAAFLARADSSPAPPGPEGNPSEPTVSLQLTDAQARMNVLNLIEGQSISPLWLGAFGQLFAMLGLPAQELEALAESLRLANESASQTGIRKTSPLLPQQTAQLVSLGLSPATLAALEPFVTVLPARTPLNLNSASVEVMTAAVPGFTRTDAERVAGARRTSPFQSVVDAGVPAELNNGQFSVVSRFFELRAELRTGLRVVTEQALLQREGLDVRLLWRKRSAAPAASPLAGRAGP